MQAMVEFDSVDTAKTAKEKLHGSDIYSGCTLKIEYAKPNKLNVYKNDSDTYDFTNPNLGKGFDMDGTNGYSTSQQQPNQNAYKNMDLRGKIPKVSKEKPIKELKHDQKILTEDVESKTKKIKALEESQIGKKKNCPKNFTK